MLPCSGIAPGVIENPSVTVICCASLESVPMFQHCWIAGRRRSASDARRPVCVDNAPIPDRLSAKQRRPARRLHWRHPVSDRLWLWRRLSVWLGVSATSNRRGSGAPACCARSPADSGCCCGPILTVGLGFVASVTISVVASGGAAWSCSGKTTSRGASALVAAARSGQLQRLPVALRTGSGATRSTGRGAGRSAAPGFGAGEKDQRRSTLALAPMLAPA